METHLNVPEAAKVPYRQSLRQFIMLISSRTRRAIMSTLVKLGFASLIACWMIPATSLASPSSASQQTTPTPSAKADKQTNAPAKARPNPDAAGKYHVGDGVTAPKLIHSVQPKWSKKVQKENISGSCMVSFTVDTNGNTIDVNIVRSTPDPKDQGMSDVALEMQESCVKTVQQYRFSPAIYQGNPVPVGLMIEINFQRS
jgi:TonB family protein